MALKAEEPESLACKQYAVFKQASGKTAKSILVSTAVRLATFNIEQMKNITNHDEMDIQSLGEKKIALFAIIPDNDVSFNYLVGMLYTQIFIELYYQADKVHGGRLPMPVHFVLDEFANVALPEDFEKCLATMRSSDLQSGDLIFWSFKPNGRFMNVTHTGIYVGDGMIIDASFSRGIVVYREIFGVNKIVACARPHVLD